MSSLRLPALTTLSLQALPMVAASALFSSALTIFTPIVVYGKLLGKPIHHQRLLGSWGDGWGIVRCRWRFVHIPDHGQSQVCTSAESYVFRCKSMTCSKYARFACPRRRCQIKGFKISNGFVITCHNNVPCALITRATTMCPRGRGSDDTLVRHKYCITRTTVRARKAWNNMDARACMQSG